MSREVKSIDELKAAIESGETEIISYDSDVVKKLMAVKLAKSWGPAAVAGIIVALPLVLTTGPIGAVSVHFLVEPVVATYAGVATSTIFALIVLVGGTIAIGLFTDWEYVEIGIGGVKMNRKKS